MFCIGVYFLLDYYDEFKYCNHYSVEYTFFSSVLLNKPGRLLDMWTLRHIVLCRNNH